MIPKVSIIILNWNGKKDTIECLESLKKVTYPNYEILLVDNGSADGSIEYFKEYYQDLEIIKNMENKGFAEGNNIGIRKAIENKADYILLLNNDTEVDSEFITELVNVAVTNNNIGIVGPIIYEFEDKNSIQSFGIRLKLYNGRTYNIKSKNKNIQLSNYIEKRDYLTGCAMLIKTSVFEKIKGFDPVYFAYWEDTDLCFQVRKNNYSIYVTSNSKIWHKGSQSTGGYMNKNAYYYYIRNSLYFYYKNFPKLFVYYFVYLFLFYLPCLVVYGIINHRTYLIKAFIKGIKDSFSLIQSI